MRLWGLKRHAHPCQRSLTGDLLPAPAHAGASCLHPRHPRAHCPLPDGTELPISPPFVLSKLMLIDKVLAHAGEQHSLESRKLPLSSTPNTPTKLIIIVAGDTLFKFSEVVEPKSSEHCCRRLVGPVAH